MNISYFEVSPDLPISFALGSNLADRIEPLPTIDGHVDATAAKYVHTLVLFAYEATTAIKNLEEEIRRLRERLTE